MLRVLANSGTQRFKGVEEEDFKPHSASYAHLTEPHLNEKKNLDFDLTPKSKFAGHVRKPMSRVFASSRFRVSQRGIYSGHIICSFPETRYRGLQRE